MTWPRAAPGLWRSPPSCLRSPRRRFPVPARPHATGRGCCQPPHPVITQLYHWNTSSICNHAEDRLQRLDDFQEVTAEHMSLNVLHTDAIYSWELLRQGCTLACNESRT